MNEPTTSEVHLLLPVGTQVVTRVAGRARQAGAVGVVVQAPADATHSYRVRFPDGTEAALRRSEIALRRQVQREGIGRAADDPIDLDPYVIYRCVIGSRAYGLDEAASDTDRRGIYLPPASLHWSLAGVPEQIERDEAQEVYWELSKFLTLALKANPNVLECLYTPLIEHATPLAEELLAMRGAFLSKLIYQTYNGYVLSQFRKLEADLRTVGAPKWKHVMHLIRLLLGGITALRDGTIAVSVEAHREQLLAIRRGELPWAAIDAWRLALHREFDAALADTALPERPDYARVDAFLVRARRSMVEGIAT